MSVKKYLSTQPLYEITKYKMNPESMEDAVCFTGTIRKHPYDSEKLLLITEPFTSETKFFEFLIPDIVYYEEKPNITTDSGESLFMVKIWVKNDSYGMQYHPFVVSDGIRYLDDSEILHHVIFET